MFKKFAVQTIELLDGNAAEKSLEKSLLMLCNFS
jgi:hypothetical protein